MRGGRRFRRAKSKVFLASHIEELGGYRCFTFRPLLYLGADLQCAQLIWFETPAGIWHQLNLSAYSWSSRLTERGGPTANLFTGMQNSH